MLQNTTIITTVKGFNTQAAFCVKTTEEGTKGMPRLGGEIV